MEDDGDLVIETIRWQDDNTVLISCIVQIEGQEDYAAFIQLISIDGDVLDEQHIKKFAVDIMTVQVVRLNGPL